MMRIFYLTSNLEFVIVILLFFNKYRGKISFTLVKKFYCTGTFIYISQAVDRVWHADLLCKLKCILPRNNNLILKNLLRRPNFSMRVGLAILLPTKINTGVPQSTVTTNYFSTYSYHPN